MYRFVLDITEMLDRQNYSDFAKCLDQELLLLFNKKFVKNQKGNNTYTNIPQRRWTIIALRNLIFYFWSNIELTWHECSFMSQITNPKEKM